jgi:hypothetical protein
MSHPPPEPARFRDAPNADHIRCVAKRDAFTCARLDDLSECLGHRPADTAEHTTGTVIHLHGDEELEFPPRRPEEVASRLVETKSIGDAVELLLRNLICAQRGDCCTNDA